MWCNASGAERRLIVGLYRVGQAVARRSTLARVRLTGGEQLLQRGLGLVGRYAAPQLLEARALLGEAVLGVVE